MTPLPTILAELEEAERLASIAKKHLDEALAGLGRSRSGVVARDLYAGRREALEAIALMRTHLTTLIEALDAANARAEAAEAKVAEALLNPDPWRPIEELTQDESTAWGFRIQAPSLVDEDFNPLGVAEATISCDAPEGYTITAAKWNGTHDCWDTVDVEDAVYFCKHPAPPMVLACKDCRSIGAAHCAHPEECGEVRLTHFRELKGPGQ